MKKLTLLFWAAAAATAGQITVGYRSELATYPFHGC